MQEFPHDLHLVILGAGGHASVLLDAVRLAHPSWNVAFLDPAYDELGHEFHGLPVLGDDSLLPHLQEYNPSLRFSVGLGSVGSSQRRMQLYDLARSIGLKSVNIVHPGAVVSTGAQLRLGVQIFAGAIVNPGAIIGVNSIVNTGAIVEHDCAVADHVHVAPRACLSGEVRVGAGAHVGTGAVVLQGVFIGEGAIIGAGAVVVRNVPANTVAVGVPARSIENRGGRE